MQVIITARNSDNTAYTAQSADGRYTWFCGQDDFINDVQAARSIYQMAYINKAGEGLGSKPLPADVEADARAFWAALREAEAATIVPKVINLIPVASDSEFAARRAAEKHFDDINNEGGEGYNPYRAS